MSRQFLQQRVIEEEPSINLTPLIDVVFVILIMFIVIAPLLEMEKIDLAQASPAAQEISNVKQKSPITIEVKNDNAIRINQTIIPLEQLLNRLKKLKEAYPTAKPQLFHDKKAFFGTYQEIKTALEIAGFEEMDLILKPS
ncbi:MAG: ExbD/TolR family protein [Parachlamydiaceae bacterium]